MSPHPSERGHCRSLAASWKVTAIMAHVLHGVVLGDRWITVPCAVILVSSGVAMAVQAELRLLHVGWIWPSLLLFAAVWCVVHVSDRAGSAPFAGMAQAANGNAANMDWPAYTRLSRHWLSMGALAILASAVALVLMVLKPG